MASKRTGGRKARQKRRTTAADRKIKAVQPGHVGGRFQPLSENEMARIHEAVLEVLENIGLSQAIPSCVELVTQAGGQYTDDGRLLFPRSLIEHTLEVASHEVTLYGQLPRHDLHLGGDRVYFGTAGAAVQVVDEWKTSDGTETSGAYRESTLQDLYDAARLVDYLDHIHFFQRCMVARDIESPSAMDLNTCYASILGTAKHVGSSFVSADTAREALKMLHQVAGSEQHWRQRPFISVSTCFVVPPLRFARDACEVIEVCVAGGIPVLLLAAGQAGATSPASLAGAVVQSMAEVLAGLAYVNLLAPAHPTILGPWPFVSDLRTGAMSGGSGEQAVLMAACGQMGRYYDIPTGIAAGMTDAKIPDAQSGYEKGYTATLAGHSGANMIYETAGMKASLMGFSFEGCVIDNDMLGAINRSVRGIEVDDESLSIEAIRDVCIDGPEHFLGHSQTLARMERDYVYPHVGNRDTPSEWKQLGATTVNIKARDMAQQILSTHYPRHIEASLDECLRTEFDILLSAQHMQPDRSTDG